MKPIQLRINLFFLLLSGLCGWFAYDSYKLFKKLQVAQKNIESIVIVRDVLDEIDKKPNEDVYIKKIQNIRAQLQPAERQILMSDVIQAFTSNNRFLLKKRSDVLVKYDKSILNKFQAQVSFLEKKLLFHSSIFLIGAIGLLTFFRMFIANNIFKPLNRTTLRMIDFLNGKYSYYFGNPPENEMGELQGTFNSMAQEVLRNMDELKALDAAKSDFLNIASHELRTPMTSIKGSLSLISSGVMGEINPEILNLIKIAETETDRLIRLINDILDMAKIDARKLPLKLEWHPLSDLIEKTVMSLQGLGQQFNVQIKVHPYDNIEIHMDGDRIQQVLTNLLSNAIKFSSKDSYVEVFVEAVSHQPISINVRDHGKGMTPQEKSILFQKFRQVTSPDNPLVKGTGLGLAIAKALVDEHKGTIDVNTVPNEGCTFYFTLPKWRYQQNIQERIAA